MSDKQHKRLKPPLAAAKLGIGLSTLWTRARKEPRVPRPIKIGPTTTIFLEAELDEFLEHQSAESRGTARVPGTRKTGGQA